MRTDLWMAWRGLTRDRGFAFVAWLAFTLAIAATTIVYGVVHAILLEQAGWSDPPNMVRVLGSKRSSSGTRAKWESVSWSAYSDLRKRDDLFRETAASRKMIYTVTNVPVPDQVFGYMVTGNYFGLLTGRPLMGRTLLARDEDGSAPAVAVISYEAWRRVFGKDPGVVGKHATIDGTAYAVVGVMRPEFVFPGDRPLVWTVVRDPSPDLNVDAVALLRGAMPPVGALRLGPARDEQIRLERWRDAPDQKIRGTLLVCLGLVGSLAFLGCLNVAALLLARSTGRIRQHFIQVATGATHGRLARQAIFETLLLASAGLVVAVPLSKGALEFVRDWALRTPTGLNNAAAIHLDATVLLASFAAAVTAALLGASAPVFTGLSLDFTQPLRASGYGHSLSRSSRGVFAALIATEAALTVTLLATAGLFGNNLLRLLRTDHGFRPEHVLAMRLPVGSIVRLRRDPAADRAQESRYRELVALARETPGVQSAALTSTLPLSHVAVSTHFRRPAVATTSSASPIEEALSEAVTPDYFRTMRMPVMAGRSFSPEEDRSDAHVVMVNSAFERKFFGGQSAVGQMLYPETPAFPPERIIGVVKDSAFIDYDEAVLPALYLPFAKRLVLPLTGMVVRSEADPAALAGILRRRFQAAQPDQAVVQLRTLSSMVEESTWLPRLAAWLFEAFAALALVLACTGIFGVMSYLTALRRRETGIRLALGARHIELWRRSVAGGQVPVVLGLMVGLATSLALARVLQSLLYQAEAVDLGALVGSAFVLTTASVAASGIAAATVFRSAPSAILRQE